MNRNIAAILIFSCVTVTSYATTIKLDGKAYNINFSEYEPKVCPTDGPNGPEWSAVKFIIAQGFGTAYGISEAKCIAACDSGDQSCEQACTTDPQKVDGHKKFAFKVVAKQFYDYPPSYKNEACKQVRDLCIAKCTELDVFGESECSIRCNQFNPTID